MQAQSPSVAHGIGGEPAVDRVGVRMPPFWMADLAKKMAEIHRRISALAVDDRGRAERRRSASRDRARRCDPMCRRHRNFGADARGCSPPCSYGAGNAGPGR